MAAAVEVDQGLQGDLRLDVFFLLGFGDLLAEVVEGGYVGVVVVLVVQLHDLAGDGGFERAVVVWRVLVAGTDASSWCDGLVHGRSGSVAFPRTNVVPARPARDVVGAAARAAERRADVRRSAVFMVASIDVVRSIECVVCCCWW